MLIRAIGDARRDLDAAVWEIDRADENSPDDLDKAFEDLKQLRGKLDTFVQSYEESLPRPVISRDPFSGEIFSYPIDTFGLDGPWWDNAQPVRPTTLLPPNVFALTGALNITGKAPQTFFTIKPGPAVPWVSPRLLSHSGMKAVVSEFRVGDYPAYAVIYFTIQALWDHPGINTWGLDTYIARHRDGSASIEGTLNLESEYDFELGKWIRRGRLLWIAPDDPAMQLRSTLFGCPYLNLEGYRFPVRLFKGALENCLLDGPNEKGS